MPLAEFDIIQNCFASQAIQHDDVKLGIGDDAAVLATPAGKELVIAIDTLVAGVHFPHQTPAQDIAYKALAVNLSDLAAMGASPAWFTLALTLPESNEQWLYDFSSGLFELANRFHLPLVGGDTTRGPLTVTVQIAGYVAPGKALTRSGAMPGDAICVTGTLGDGAAGLKKFQQQNIAEKNSVLLNKLFRPEPRIAAGRLLSAKASACIDISDGLYADLNHMMQQSGTGARLALECLPLSEEFSEFIEDESEQWSLALCGGDDYELCFCVPPEMLEALSTAMNTINCRMTKIGEVEQAAEIRIFKGEQEIDNDRIKTGYQHFQQQDDVV